MKSIQWFIYGVDYFFRTRCRDKDKYILPYCKKDKILVSSEEANDILRNELLSGRSFFAGRFGFFEVAAMRAYEFKHKKKYETVIRQIYDCAGFFPMDISLGDKFLNLMKESLSVCDMMGCSWQMAENYFFNQYLKKGAYVASWFDVMEPWRFDHPWTAALEGKKVLVIHPFEDSIISQYEGSREKIFPGTDILPKFELKTYKALQTTGDLIDERFSDWFEALNFMFDEISKIEFDVALIGCGAYGYPLGAMIKNMGKQAVHMGGVLQLLFGIMGKRWDGTGPNSNTKEIRADLKPYFNEYWTYPLDSETPKSASKVEYGPYWK